MLQLVMMHHSISGTGRQSRGGNAGFFRQSTAGVRGATQEPAERPIPGAGRPVQFKFARPHQSGGSRKGKGPQNSLGADSGTQEPATNVEAMKILATLVLRQGDTLARMETGAGVFFCRWRLVERRPLCRPWYGSQKNPSLLRYVRFCWRA